MPADLPIIRDAIHALIRDEQGARPEQVAAAAQAYAAACRDINRRLQRCDEYLSRGLRSEAVQLAWCPPNILHLAAAARLEDAAAWDRLCARHGQQRPPHPQAEIVARLVSAIEEDRRLAPLLDRLRVLTLARAPVAERIDLVRALRAQDAENPAWVEQLRLLEPARLEELRQEAEAPPTAPPAAPAAPGGGLAAEGRLTAILAELDDPRWVTQPDGQWLAALRQRRDALRHAAALAELPAGALAEALRARDYERCTVLLSRWQAVMARHPQLTLPEPLQRQVRQASAWIAGETRRRTINERMRAAAGGAAPPSPGEQPPPTPSIPPSPPSPATPAARATGAVRRIFQPRGGKP